MASLAVNYSPVKKNTLQVSGGILKQLIGRVSVKDKT